MPYINFMQVVIETPDYLTDAKALGLLEDERRAIILIPGMKWRVRAERKKFGLLDEVKEKAGAIGLLPFLPVMIYLCFCCPYFQKVKKPICRKRKEMNWSKF